MKATLIKKCIPMLVCACFPVLSQAANVSTVAHGEWYDGANWFGMNPPNSTDDATLNNDMISAASITVGSINGPGSVTTGGNLILLGVVDSVLTQVSVGGLFNFYGAPGTNLTIINGSGITGPVEIIDGNLIFGQTNSLVNASNVTIHSGVTMNLNGFNQEIRNINALGTVNLGASRLEVIGNSSFTGEIIGSGQLILNNAQRTTISGNNTGYSGLTSVRGGAELVIGHDNALGSGILELVTATISNSGNRTISNSIESYGSLNTFSPAANTRLEISGGISGFTPLVKTGLGELVLSGSNSFTSPMEVNQGKLSIASSGFVASEVRVNNGATLGGTGVVGGATINAGGTLAPGNSIGNLAIIGPLDFNTGSQFNVELDATGASDHVNVAGSVTINTGSTLNIDGAAGTYGPSTTYSLITASGGITGNFDTINSNLAFLNTQLTNTGNQIQLTLSSNGVDFVDVARTYNQRNAALALMSVGAGTLATAVTSLDGDTARSAFGQLSGEVHASAQGALVDDTDFVRSAVTQRLYQPDGNAVWFKGSSIHGYTDRNSNTDSTSRHMNGGLVGSDRTIGDGNWTIGVFGGYGDTNFNTQRSRADIKTVHLGAYAGRAYDKLQLKLGAGYAYHRLDTSRNLGFGTFTGRDKADYDTHSLQAFADVGYRIKSGDGSIEPFLNVAQVHLAREGFNERGDDAALRVSREQSNVTLGTIGVRLDQPLTTSTTLPLRLQGSIGYRHAEGDVTPRSEARLAGGNSFDVRGNPIARQAAVYDIGVYSQLSPTLSAGINYRGQNGDNTRIHAANFNLTWLF